MTEDDRKDEIEKIEPVKPSQIPHWRLVWDQAGITPAVIDFAYAGSGSEDDPYVVQWIPHDPRNPMEFSVVKKWSLTMVVAFGTLAVTMVSSAFSGGIIELIEDFHISAEVATLGISLFVLGFAIGPLLWAPLSELYGRQWVFLGTYMVLTIFSCAAAGAPNTASLLIFRFIAGSFGSSPLTNAGGVIADMFPASHRGLAMAFFAAAPFLGPTLGPVIGGFLGMNAGWRWVQGFLGIFCGILWILGVLVVPETYAPVILRSRAARLSKITGQVYQSRVDVEHGGLRMKDAFVTALSRPWVLLLKEPIVLLLSVYLAIVYGTLYMLFAAFPIVYQRGRGWNQGVGGLAFIGIMVGMAMAILYSTLDNRRYVRIQKENDGWAPPEARLPSSLVGSIALPIGLFWFAWANGPSVHWLASVAAGVPFGFGMVLVFLSSLNYLIDAYTIFAASVLAASSVLRSCFGAAFPLFTSYMYNSLGIHWASSIPAFLALACVPFPFLFYRYVEAIRARCKFSAQSIAFMKKLQQEGMDEEEAEEVAEGDEIYDRTEEPPLEAVSSRSSSDSGEPGIAEMATPSRTRSMASSRTGRTLSRQKSSYDGNPYDIDRVNTRQSDFSLR
ncbi:hypothetical protein Egran_04015 [Elaphomyces granulatus]|uniref:Major facilitator superfamily (MFS) profile domain-containing protein n=1 Tax=Elaphomyces granulatus TaxID=519963 RepID=A0A232LVT6_9EURO|nr:hypothetical protein Egran_04015 [Elaphomyces granulatus]